MDKRDAADIVKQMKDGARAAPWVPFGAPPRERYHHLPNGLALCFTLDILSPEHVARFVSINGSNIPEYLAQGGWFWHLSIARPGGPGLRPEEMGFWRRAFFAEAPIIEMSGLLPGVNSRHFFWRVECKSGRLGGHY